MSTHNICFFLRNKKAISIFRMKKAPYLLLCIITIIMMKQSWGLIGEQEQKKTASRTTVGLTTDIYGLLYSYPYVRCTIRNLYTCRSQPIIPENRA